MVRGFGGRSVLQAVAAACLLLCATTAAWAQTGGSTATLTGSVVDSDGGVIPGATVEVKNNATGVVESVVTNAAGVFSVPGLNPGTYSVTVALSGFKTSVVSDVRLTGGTTAGQKRSTSWSATAQTLRQSDLVANLYGLLRPQGKTEL